MSKARRLKAIGHVNSLNELCTAIVGGFTFGNILCHYPANHVVTCIWSCDNQPTAHKHYLCCDHHRTYAAFQN